MPIDVVGSHMAPEAFAGQNGDFTSPSLLPGQKIKRGTFAKTIIAADPVTAGAGDWQTRKVTAKPIKATPGMRDPNKSPAKVPPITARRDRAGAVRPTR